MIALLLNPLVLCLLVWVVARSSAEFDFPRMFFIAVGVGLLGAALGALVEGYLVLLTLIPVAALLVFLLMKYCCLTLGQALVVTGLYFAYQILFIVAMDRILR
jgi:hypothetical protein